MGARGAGACARLRQSGLVPWWTRSPQFSIVCHRLSLLTLVVDDLWMTSAPSTVRPRRFLLLRCWIRSTLNLRRLLNDANPRPAAVRPRPGGRPVAGKRYKAYLKGRWARYRADLEALKGRWARYRADLEALHRIMN